MGDELSFAAQLRALREARGLSRSVLSRRTAREGDPGVAEATITKLEREAERWPEDATIRALGDALEPVDGEFPAYALAQARALFDERVVGLDAALENLSRIERSLLAAARQTASEVERQASSAQQRREAGRAPATRKAAGRRGRA